MRKANILEANQDTLASDALWDAKVFHNSKFVGNIARFFINHEIGAISGVEVARRFGRRSLLIRWDQLRFDFNPLRAEIVGEIAEMPDPNQDVHHVFCYMPGFWGGA